MFLCLLCVKFKGGILYHFPPLCPVLFVNMFQHRLTYAQTMRIQVIKLLHFGLVSFNQLLKLVQSLDGITIYIIHQPITRIHSM